MELKKGFKRTEGGIIPTDWSDFTIGDLLFFQGGSQPDKNTFISSEKPGYIRLIQIRDYKTDKYKTYIPFGLARRFCEIDDIMIGRYGPPIFQILKGVKGAYNVALIKAIPQYPLDKIYAYYFLKQEKLFSFVEKLSQRSSGQTGVDLKELKNYPLPLPPTTAEQTAIANALSDADALIQFLSRLITKKRQIKQGAMQTLLTGEKRLPMFVNSMNYQNTDIGIIPEDWDCVAMGDIGQSLIGLTYNPSNVKDYGTLVLRSSNVQGDQLAFENNVFVDMELPKRVMVEPDDILICVRNGSRQLIGKCALIDDRVKGAAFGAFMSVYRSKYSRFIFYQFQSHIIQKQIEELMGATINQITNKDLSVFKVVLPKNEEEQTCIATILSDMDTEIAALETKLAKYRHIKQGMMQSLLTGRIRLI